MISTSTSIYAKILDQYDKYLEATDKRPDKIVFSKEAIKNTFPDGLPEKLYGMKTSVCTFQKDLFKLEN
jgi:hypothetical protein